MKSRAREQIRRWLASGPMVAWAAIIAGGTSVLIDFFLALGWPVVGLAVFASLAQLVLYVMIAFGDGVTPQQHSPTWWQRLLLVGAALSQVVRGTAFLAYPATRASVPLAVVGAAGCLCALIALLNLARQYGSTAFMSLLSAGVGIGFAAFVTILIGAPLAVPALILLVASGCEVGAGIARWSQEGT